MLNFLKYHYYLVSCKHFFFSVEEVEKKMRSKNPTHIKLMFNLSSIYFAAQFVYSHSRTVRGSRRHVFIDFGTSHQFDSFIINGQQERERERERAYYVVLLNVRMSGLQCFVYWQQFKIKIREKCK